MKTETIIKDFKRKSKLLEQYATDETLNGNPKIAKQYMFDKSIYDNAVKFLEKERGNTES